MANLTRFDPFWDVDDLFRGFMLKPVRFEQQMPQMQIRMDVKENDNAYVIHAEIPGVNKEDIKVDVNGNVVSIAAEVKREKEEKKGELVIRSERYYGQVSRSLSLASDVNESAAEAKYADGVLELTLPKKTRGTANKIVVK